MKFLKRLLLVIAILVGIYLIMAMLSPKDYKVERSRVMDASDAAIWEQIANFKNWPNWSPWQEKDPDVKNEFSGEMGQAGSTMSWVGDPDLTGTGSMVITKLSKGENLYYDLKFEVPFEMQSNGGFELTEESGKVKVAWFDQGDIPFLMRPMMLFMDLDGQIGTDFERGLEKLDSVASLSNPENAMISLIDFPDQNYVGIRNKVSIAEAMKSEFYAANFASLGKMFGEKQLEMAGMPVTIVYSWNEQDSIADLAPAFPVKSIDFELSEGYELILVKGRRAVLGKHFGSYESTGETHGAIERFIAEKGLKYDLVIEEYANDPAEVKPEEILTNLYYLIVD